MVLVAVVVVVAVVAVVAVVVAVVAVVVAVVSDWWCSCCYYLLVSVDGYVHLAAVFSGW